MNFRDFFGYLYQETTCLENSVATEPETLKHSKSDLSSSCATDSPPKSSNKDSDGSSSSKQENCTSKTCEDEDETSLNEDDETEDPSSLHIVGYDKEGNRFTLNDYLNYKVTDTKLKNYFAKQKRKLDQMCINDHRVMQGLEPIKFSRKRKKTKRQVSGDEDGKAMNNEPISE